jgi:peptidoglycan hydrolase-like protein with peptidoglycan-binding domain
MKPLAIVLAVAISFPAAALAGREFSSNHPEEQYPGNLAPLTSGGPYEELLKQVQEKLRAHGFDAGPANGTYSTKMQAALAQFQLASSLPASGALDDATLFELGVDLKLANAPEETERDASGATPEKESG